jgi:hypothetical protein
MRLYPFVSSWWSIKTNLLLRLSNILGNVRKTLNSVQFWIKWLLEYYANIRTEFLTKLEKLNNVFWILIPTYRYTARTWQLNKCFWLTNFDHPSNNHYRKKNWNEQNISQGFFVRQSIIFNYEMLLAFFRNLIPIKNQTSIYFLGKSRVQFCRISFNYRK